MVSYFFSLQIMCNLHNKNAQNSDIQTKQMLFPQISILVFSYFYDKIIF